MPNPRLRQYLFWGGLMFALYTAFAVLSAVGTHVSEVGMDHPIEWLPLFRQEFKDWYACGLLSLGVLWFCNHNPLEPNQTRRWVLSHIAASLVFCCIYALFASWWIAGEKSVMHPGKILTFSYLLKQVGIHYCLMNMIMYWLVVFAHLGWTYHKRFHERELQNAELKRELTEARLSALRMQLNPHFLFNTLHAVSALIHDNPEGADRVVARLSELLRLSLDQSRPQEVPLTEELNFLERYLEIEQTRFAERLKIDKQVDSEAEQALVPFLILQPLVENAIRHGIEPRAEAGHLGISAQRKNGTLELRVTDNGVGLGSTACPAATEGIGLSNTRSRLQHLYGKQFRFELTDGQEGGLEARIEIPFRTRAAAR